MRAIKGKRREDTTNCSPYYCTASLIAYLKCQENHAYLARTETTLAAGGSFNKFFQYFPVTRPSDKDFGLKQKILHNIDECIH